MNNYEIICAIIIAGAALLYDTKEVCESLAHGIDGAEVVRIESFSDII